MAQHDLEKGAQRANAVDARLGADFHHIDRPANVAHRESRKANGDRLNSTVPVPFLGLIDRPDSGDGFEPPVLAVRLCRPYGPLPVVREGDSRRPGVIKALMRRGLLSYFRPGAVGVYDHRVLRPQATWMTDAGREALAALLADYADTLVRAQAIRDLMPKMSESAPEPQPAAPAKVAKLPQTSNA